MKTPNPRTRGRQRDETRRLAILRAAYKLLLREGLENITSVALAREAGVSTATLYRWWPSKEAIVMDGYLAVAESRARPTLAGETALDALRHELVAGVEAVAGAEGRALASLVTYAHRSKEVYEAFQNRFLRPRRAQIKTLLHNAVDQGQIRRDLDLELVLDALYAPIYYHLLVAQIAPSREFIERHLELVVAGAAPA